MSQTKALLIIGIALTSKLSFAQFTGTTGNISQSTSGNVGIGILSPASAISLLEVKNGSVLFDGTTGAFPPLTGAGTRMLWYPAKGAFRAGVVNGAQWDDANIGAKSFACGENTTALGAKSFASGTGTAANGQHSFATGSNTTATALFSFASGTSSTASGVGSFATGSSTTASGQYSTSFGGSSISSSAFSTAFGNYTTAWSYNSFVIGRYNTTSLTTLSWVATEPLFVIGNGASTTARNNAVTVLKNGNVLIDKATQVNSTYKLDVNGKMRALEIVVNTTGADFVFDENYELMPLAILEQKIKTEKHLPEIASAEEMQANGVGLGELNTKLLQKTEELTLYIIELNKRITELEKK